LEGDRRKIGVEKINDTAEVGEYSVSKSDQSKRKQPRNMEDKRGGVYMHVGDHLRR